MPVDPGYRQLLEVSRIAAEAQSRTVILLERALPYLEQSAGLSIPDFPDFPTSVVTASPSTDDLLRQVLVRLDELCALMKAPQRSVLIRDAQGHAVASQTQVVAGASTY